MKKAVMKTHPRDGSKKRHGLSISRRTFAFGMAGACAVVGLGGLKYLPSRALCRPPGGQNEDYLTSACIHCEKCREICPRNAIAPAHIEDGVLNARTPRMAFRQGWCDFCENEPRGPRCVEVCPTRALRAQDAAEAIIGVAVLNRDWCLAAKGMGCHECVDVCSYEAMSIGGDHVPLVDESACNGCGACEFACISMSAGSVSVGATDRAIVVRPQEKRNLT
ncbi:MAG: 4Fe-4S dicluster domain-containing protein [Coriobacteriales bacterium]|jgi:ferredoxin-type protein NapG|nr:4Fe-4S dicluster domain-containing protein [Coriobacteriales bacterium]